MKNVFYFWGVLRPDGKLIPSTFSHHKLEANHKAVKLCRSQLNKRWCIVKKEAGYKLVLIECRIMNNGQVTKPTVGDKIKDAADTIKAVVDTANDPATAFVMTYKP